MSYGSLSSPRWLRFLERRMQWLAIPHISILIVTLQALGFLMVLSSPFWIERLALIPGAVTQGEYWRLITFLAIPVTGQVIWMFFALWFLYFILNAIEEQWGAFKTTLYVLVSVIITIAVSFALDYPIVDAADFQSTWFLAAASLFPEMQIQLFLVIPVKMKWLGWLTLGFWAYRLIGSDWHGRIYLLAIYSNYLIFFGPAFLDQVRQAIRRRDFQRKMRR